MIDKVLKARMIEGLSSYVAGNNPLRPHQVDACRDTIEFLERPGQPVDEDSLVHVKHYDGGSLSMATGTGKTWIQLAIAVAMGQKTVIASPRIRLNTQALETYTHPEKFGLSADDIAVYDSERSPEERAKALSGAKILITTDIGFRALHKSGIISNNPDSPNYRPLIILDESDLFIGFENGKLTRQYRDSSIVLGFSATPHGVNRELFDNQPHIHTLPVRDAVHDGLLVRGIKTAVIDVKPDNLGIQEYVRANASADYPLEALERFAKNEAVIRAVILEHANRVDGDLGPIRRLPTLIAVPQIGTAKLVADEFNKVFGDGYAVAVSGETPHEDVKHKATGELVQQGLSTTIENFNKGKIRVLVFPEVLGRGVDIGNATVLFSLRPYLIPGPAEQHLGRLTRRGEEDYFRGYGMDKVALGINVRTPGMKSILFSQIIGEPCIYEPGERRKYNGSEPALTPIDLPAIGEVKVTTNVTELAKLYEDAERARLQREGAIPEGWVDADRAAEITGIAVEEVLRRARGIHRDKMYTTLGLPKGIPGVDANLPEVFGQELKQHIAGKVVLDEKMVEEWRKIEERTRELRSRGAKTLREIADAYGTKPNSVRKALGIEGPVVKRGARSEKVGDVEQMPDGMAGELEKKKKPPKITK